MGGIRLHATAGRHGPGLHRKRVIAMSGRCGPGLTSSSNCLLRIGLQDSVPNALPMVVEGVASLQSSGDGVPASCAFVVDCSRSLFESLLNVEYGGVYPTHKHGNFLRHPPLEAKMK